MVEPFLGFTELGKFGGDIAPNEVLSPSAMRLARPRCASPADEHADLRMARCSRTHATRIGCLIRRTTRPRIGCLIRCHAQVSGQSCGQTPVTMRKRGSLRYCSRFTAWMVAQSQRW